MTQMVSARAVTRMCLVLACCAGLGAQAAQTPSPPLAASRTPPAPVQPLPYSHRFHVGDLGMACTECHANPGAGKLMTYPPAATCVSCHRSNPAGRQTLQALTAAVDTGKPIPWVRVYRVPEYVYWQHGPHLAAGVACVECHGPVGERDVVALETDVTTMRGCQRCHEKRQVLTDCGDCHEPRQ
jgi:hypothetical protein